MDKIIKDLKKHKVYVEDLFILREGETSNTYLANQKDKKVIVKIFKNNNLGININSYLEINILDQLTQRKIFPKVITHKQDYGILIYEYVESLSYKKNQKFISRLGNQIKKIHDIKVKNDFYHFDEQIEKYKTILGKKLGKDFQRLDKLITKAKQYKSKICFSHNDLNRDNIIHSKEIYFIDYEYASLNNIFCDITRVIQEYSLNEPEINILFNSYGIQNSDDVTDQIEIWKNINMLIDKIWTEMMIKTNLKNNIN